jgi:hypothetical protein
MQKRDKYIDSDELDRDVDCDRYFDADDKRDEHIDADKRDKYIDSDKRDKYVDSDKRADIEVFRD